LNLALAQQMNFLTFRTIAFVVGFSTFLIACIDWSRIRGSHNLAQIIIPHGLSKHYHLVIPADLLESRIVAHLYFGPSPCFG
jgi:hypothetical protein